MWETQSVHNADHFYSREELKDVAEKSPDVTSQLTYPRLFSAARTFFNSDSLYPLSAMVLRTDTKSLEPSLKRRKVRKGTTSCWECKRRKVRCEYDEDNEATVCKPCLQRGSQCISQDLPEPTPPYSYIPTPASNVSEAVPGSGPRNGGSSRGPWTLSPWESITNLRNNEEKLSRYLHGALPSQEDIIRLCDSSSNPSILAHAINTLPYAVLKENYVSTRDTLLDIPPANAHPVLMAKHMLLLASFIQQLHPTFLAGISGLSETPKATMERLTDLAASLVTTNDKLLGTIEGLECVMIESLYQMNIGSLRRAWVSVRRALSIAQLMGLHRPNPLKRFRTLDPRTRYHPQHMWFKIVFLDRYLCRLLGLPQGCNSNNFASEPLGEDATAIERLEKIHCDIAGRILDRNEDRQGSEDMALTRSLDAELQKAAKTLPSKWWLTPNLAAGANDPESSFWNTRQLFAQMLHYNLLNQLHLPYVLCSMRSGKDFEYARIACVNASREMLSRWIALRNFNSIACSCRSVDFVALMAAMTLILSHLHSQRFETNLLAHQHHSDRAMIEQVQEGMEYMHKLNSDALCARSADLLGRLLKIDSEAPDTGIDKISVQNEDSEYDLHDKNRQDAVSVHVPYFGIIRIAREGMSRHRSSDFSPAIGELNAIQEPTSSHAGSLGSLGNIQVPSQPTVPVNPDANQDETSISQAVQEGFSSSVLGQYPSLAAGTEDWAFQGVDQAFFESLMGSGWNDGNESFDWSAL